MAGGALIRSVRPRAMQTIAYGGLLVLWLLASPARAEGPSGPSPEGDVLHAQAVWSVDQARPGEQIVLSVVIRIVQGFHINADAGQLSANKGFSPYPTQIQIIASDPSLEVGAPLYPPAHRIAVGFAAQPLAVFDGQVIVAIPVTAPFDMTAGIIRIRLALRYQGCDATSCWMPATIPLAAELPIVSTLLP